MSTNGYYCLRQGLVAAVEVRIIQALTGRWLLSSTVNWQWLQDSISEHWATAAAGDEEGSDQVFE